MEQKLQYIVDKIGELNIQINEKQAEQFFRYYELLVEWNGFMNLTGITDFEEVVCKHFVDSLSIISTKDMSTVDNPDRYWNWSWISRTSRLKNCVSRM